jgi:hypothetical protein
MITRTPRIAILASVFALSAVACGTAPSATGNASTAAQAQLARASATTPPFGTSGSFAVLANTAVACTDATIIGDVGVSPGSAIVQTSCPVTGALHPNDPAATQAYAAFLVAYNAVAAMPCDQVLTTLDGLTLAPGTYCFDAAATSTGGVLTLDGPATGSWIFKIGTLGTGALTGTNFSVVTPAGTPPACGNVTWWTAQAVTLTDSQFVGNVLAGAAVTLTRGTFAGNAHSKAGVTITGDAVTGCNMGSTPGGGNGGGNGGGSSCNVGEDEDDSGDSHDSSVSSSRERRESNQDKHHGRCDDEGKKHHDGNEQSGLRVSR